MRNFNFILVDRRFSIPFDTMPYLERFFVFVLSSLFFLSWDIVLTRDFVVFKDPYMIMNLICNPGFERKRQSRLLVLFCSDG